MKRAQTLVMDALSQHPNEWLTTNDISGWLKNVTPSEVGCYLRILSSTDTRIETIIQSSHKRIYRFNEVKT